MVAQSYHLSASGLCPQRHPQNCRRWSHLQDCPKLHLVAELPRAVQSQCCYQRVRPEEREKNVQAQCPNLLFWEIGPFLGNRRLVLSLRIKSGYKVTIALTRKKLVLHLKDSQRWAAS